MKKSRKISIVSLILILLVIAGWFGYKKLHPGPQLPVADTMSLAEAAKIGTKAPYQLLIQIADKNCDPSIASGCFQRGDVVLAVPGEKQWSIAEQQGFLIIKMDLTPMEVQLLTHPLEKLSSQQRSNSSSEPLFDQQKARRFTVDLAKLGIGPDVQRGQIISDKTFTEDVIIENKIKN